MHNKYYTIQIIYSATKCPKINLDGQFGQNIFTTHLFVDA